ncbi:DUF4357 domain-containing protein [Spiroplasma endosymbiont of Amphibalanus improvisus]|uniref:DUF4357 domain-containing protein n=1 Tax=Spiroplasma endosymbiont of Amphibalanus improvisus TaxID=3066327 RepID=UPI00313AC8C9
MEKQKLTIYYGVGEYEGIKWIDTTNSLINLLILPQNNISYLTNEEDGKDYANKSGVYILVGNNDQYIYIGQTNSIKKRIIEHTKTDSDGTYNIKQDFEYLIFITTNGNSLGATDRLYIEQQLIKLASTNKNLTIENGNNGQNSNITNHEAGVLNTFINDFRKLLNNINIKIFETKILDIQTALKNTQNEDISLKVKYNDNNKLYLKHTNNEYYAEGYYVDGKFIVLKNSWTKRLTFPDYMPKRYPSDVNFFNELLNKGVLVLRGDKYIMTEDYTCNSGSQACTLFIKISTTGWTSWKNADNKTMKEIYKINPKI